MNKNDTNNILFENKKDRNKHLIVQEEGYNKELLEKEENGLGGGTFSCFTINKQDNNKIVWRTQIELYPEFSNIKYNHLYTKKFRSYSDYSGYDDSFGGDFGGCGDCGGSGDGGATGGW